MSFDLPDSSSIDVIASNTVSNEPFPLVSSSNPNKKLKILPFFNGETILLEETYNLLKNKIINIIQHVVTNIKPEKNDFLKEVISLITQEQDFKNAFQYDSECISTCINKTRKLV
jgi:AAA+ ATPase superfamily predicted ATPase